MFIAHTNEVSDGSFKPLQHYDNKRVLTNSDGNFYLNSNICPHQLSLISTEEGKDNLTCPYHGWSFDLQGNPLTSGRTEHYCKNLNSLKNFSVYRFNNLLFDTNINCKELHWLDLSKMMLKEQRVDRVNAGHKTIMDVFLDVDHIECVHSGVYNLIGLEQIDHVQWHYYDWGSLQLVAKGEVYGAAWLSVYPGTMIEWQPGALFITQSVPVSDQETDVHVFKYCDNDEDWKLNESVWETAWKQDKALAERITGFASINLEDSKKHYRSWLAKKSQ